MKHKSTAFELAKITGISLARAKKAIIKARRITTVLKAVQEKKITHLELAKHAKLPKSTVTRILSGGLLKITPKLAREIDRIADPIFEGKVKGTEWKGSLDKTFKFSAPSAKQAKIIRKGVSAMKSGKVKTISSRNLIKHLKNS
jgi:hypothetical protein